MLKENKRNLPLHCILVLIVFNFFFNFRQEKNYFTYDRKELANSRWRAKTQILLPIQFLAPQPNISKRERFFS